MPRSIEKTVLAFPPDDLGRKLTAASAENVQHIGLVGDTYTILLTGKETAGRYCVIDMHVRFRGDVQRPRRRARGFRGTKVVVRAGESIHIPANTPHRFRNSSTKAARMLCICSLAGQEEFFLE